MAKNEAETSSIAELATKYLKISDSEEKKRFLDDTCGRDQFLRPAVLKLAAELYDETIAAGEHDNTGKLEMSDLTDNGVRIFGHDWLVFQLSW